MHQRCLTCTLCCCLLFLDLGQAAADDTEGFRPLFNGRDLSGWVLVNTPNDTWSVDDEKLVCSGQPIGELRTDRMYQNFILEVEWRHMVPRGNAGIFVWADDITAKGVPFHRSVEVQVLENAYGQSQSHTTHGDIFPIHGAVMTPINGRGGSRAFPSEERSLPSPQWNHYRIECNDGQISLAVNHKVVTRGTEASPRKGYICLESEGGVVQYRNLRIKELPETPIAPEHVATANRGFVSLYSGLDLRGWNVSANDQPHWSANDWVLSFDGKTASGSSRIISSKVYTEPEFILDLRPVSGFKSLAITTAGGEQIVLISGSDPKWSSRLESSKWTRLQCTVRNEKLTLRADSRDVLADVAIGMSRLPLSLQLEGPAELANIYAREQ